MRRVFLILVVAVLVSSASAFPQYRVTRMSTMGPGLSNYLAQNDLGDMVKRYQTYRYLLRLANGSVVVSDTAPNGYSTYGAYTTLTNDRVVLGSLYDGLASVKVHPTRWSESSGYQLLPSPIISTEESATYDMYASNSSGTVFGGSFHTYIGNTYDFWPTRWRQSGSGWIGESFNGDGICRDFDDVGNAYGRFNGRSGIWKVDGSVQYLPNPYPVFNQMAGRDSQGRMYGQTVENHSEFWVWDTPTSNPRRYSIPTYPEANFAFPLQVNATGTCIYSTQLVANSGLLNGMMWSESTGPVQMDSLLVSEDASRFQIGALYSFNDHGVILALARDPALPSVSFGVVLTPVPEPSTLVLVGSGIAVLALKRRRERATTSKC